MKQIIKEYFTGDPDTIDERNPKNDSSIARYNYRDGGTISFGFFQTSYDGTKEFICEFDKGHWDFAADAKDKLVGKALANEDITPYDMAMIVSKIYNNASYCGRIFLKPRVVVFWHDLPSEKVNEILSMVKLVDSFDGYSYLIPYEKSQDLGEFINSGHAGDDFEYSLDEEHYEENIMTRMESRLADIIRTANQPQSSLLDKELDRIGMPRAKYNFYKRYGLGDSVEPKKTIKEYIMNSKIKNNEFANYMLIMSEALDNGDYKAYEYTKDILDEAINEKKHEAELMNELNTTNFGILNHIFEQELPTLFKTNKKAVKNVIKTIKEDKNLLSQFNFYNVIKEQYKGDVTEKVDEKTTLETLTKIVCEDIDFNTVKKSNKKLRDVMKENKIIPTEFVDDESRTLYESGNVILTKKQTAANTLPLIESYDTVCKYMQKHKNDKRNSTVDVNKLVREFEEKLKTNLNESEMSFVKEITDFKSPMAEKRKEKLFNKFKNECIDKINKMLSEDSTNSGLMELKSQIEEQKFNNETIVKDIAKLLEIRDILLDE